MVFDKILRARSMTRDDYDRLDTNAPDELKDMDLMVATLAGLKEAGSRVVVMPDFDTDGIMSGVILYAGLARLDFACALYEPKPGRGYGINPVDIDEMLAIYPDAKAIITCDTGITAYEAVDYAKSKELTVLVTDHHRENPDRRVAADVIVDPMRYDETYAHPKVCGAYVAWRVVDAMAQHLAATTGDTLASVDISLLRVFAGIGTISDLMEMTYENRQLVRDAMAIWRMLIPADGYGARGWATEAVSRYSLSANAVTADVPLLRSSRVNPSHPFWKALDGLAQVTRLLIVKGVISAPEDITEQTVGFYLAPMFNSVKRLEPTSRHAFGLFVDPDRASRRFHANALASLNEQRKKLVDEVLTEVTEQMQPYAPWVYLCPEKPGILGLVATRLMDETGLPTLAVTLHADGTLSGSGRSPITFPFLSSIRDLDLPVWGAGHEGAFGCRFDSLDDVARYADMMNSLCQTVMASNEPEHTSEHDYELLLSLDADADIDLRDGFAMREAKDEIDAFGPYGPGFAYPSIRLKVPTNLCELEVFGKKRNHLKVLLPFAGSLLMFFDADKHDAIKKSETIDVDVEIAVNRWGGKNELNLIAR